MIARFNYNLARILKEIIFLLLMLNASLPLSLSFAEEFNLKSKENNQPITINANRLEADSNSKLITFKGDVVTKQEGIIIYSDILILTYSKEGRNIKKVVARGNVKIIQDNEKRVATAGKAVFYNKERKVILTEDPKIWQGKDVVSGEIITLFIEENRSIIERGTEKRVNAVIHPKEK